MFNNILKTIGRTAGCLSQKLDESALPNVMDPIEVTTVATVKATKEGVAAFVRNFKYDYTIATLEQKRVIVKRKADYLRSVISDLEATLDNTNARTASAAKTPNLDAFRKDCQERAKAKA